MRDYGTCDVPQPLHIKFKYLLNNRTAAAAEILRILEGLSHYNDSTYTPKPPFKSITQGIETGHDGEKLMNMESTVLNIHYYEPYYQTTYETYMYVIRLTFLLCEGNRLGGSLAT